MTALRAALLSQLILSLLRSSVRIIKPISRRWLLQPACDWIATEVPPLALQRERMREEKNETPGKKEMRKESRYREGGSGWKRNRRWDLENVRSRSSQQLRLFTYLRPLSQKFVLSVPWIGYPSSNPFRPLPAPLLFSARKIVYSSSLLSHLTHLCA